MENNQKTPFYLNKKAFTDGMIANMSHKLSFTLLAIAAHIAEGNHSPTQEQLAKDMGVARSTVNRWVKQLVAYRWNSNPVITRKVIGGNRSVYHIVSPFVVFES